MESKLRISKSMCTLHYASQMFRRLNMLRKADRFYLKYKAKEKVSLGHKYKEKREKKKTKINQYDVSQKII